jgi:hypothetical protein
VPWLPLAHEKWFVDDPASFGADWDFALATPSLILIAAVVHAGAIDLLGIPLSGDAFIRLAGAIELLFGLLLISGARPRWR